MKMTSPSGILLTGANGFFGCHLLWELQRSGVSRLRCLIRARDRQQARTRLEMALQNYRLALPLDAIDILAVDLSQPGLGLSDQERGQLMLGIDVVVHAGACVKFTASAEEMIRTNVDATQLLLQLAQDHGVASFLYISSLAVVNGLEWPLDERVPEAPLSLRQGKTLSHYARSKMGAEQSCFAAAAQGLDVSVLRLPYLLASASTSALNRHGYFDIMLGAVLQLGRSFDDAFSLHPLPVDRCAEWVARVALARGTALVMHVLHANPMPWSEWLDAARAAGLPITMEPMEAWYRGLRQAAARTHDRRLIEALAFLKLDATHKRWIEMNAHRLQFEHRNLCTVVPEAGVPLQLSTAYKQAVVQQLLGD